MADQPADHPTYTAADLGLDDDEMLSPVDLDPQLVMVDRVHSNRPLEPAKVGALMKLDEAERQKHRILVGIRKSGSMIAIDGQHRLYACLLLGDQSIPADVFPSDGWKTEQAVYQAFSRWQAANCPKPPPADAPKDDDAG